ncbi:alpha-glucosidase-like [Uloborus diversus]|uniref:alpha-glucosidase-like n=1 Tax=Uloborus diversus TaxID=327109 RepID=UPI00240A18DE|nr:alpha-glucosidase-like [Uloborus diversus]
MTSMLPTLEDLHKKARLSQVIHPNQYVSLDTRLYPQTPGQTLANEDQRIPPVTVTQEQDEHRRPGLLRDCTTVFGCGRFKTDYPSYRPIHRQMSNSHAASSEHFVCWRDWPRIRQTCFLLTFICLAAIIFCAVISVYTSNHISKSHSSQRKDLWWYRDATFYEIFPASFQDTDADSYGDFQGIIRRLDYIRDLGMTAIRLNSIFSALDYPLEYEHIIDLHSADPHLGRMDEFRLLVDEAHHRGLKVVLDINPTITSDQHTWALHWQRGIPGYEHFYASANRSKSPPEMENSEGPPPEEWELTQRTFGGHYVLNWSNPFVQKEYQKTIAYWLDTGVDGFYMKHLEKIHVVDFHHIANIIHQWRTVLDSPPSIWNIGRSAARRILIVSSKFAETIITELGQPAKDILKYVDMLDYPILVGSGKEMAQQVSALKEVSGWPKDHPTPVWHLGSSDTFRLASRIEYRYNMAAFYLLMTLTGSRSVFYGDEIGLRDSYDVLSGRTLYVRLRDKKGGKIVRCLIDSGSQRSYLSKRAAEEMQYDRLKEENVIHNLFGGKEHIEKHYRHRVLVSSINKEYHCNFEVLNQEKICSKIPTLKLDPCAQELNKRNIILTDQLIPKETESEDIDLLIGADVAAAAAVVVVTSKS